MIFILFLKYLYINLEFNSRIVIILRYAEIFIYISFTISRTPSNFLVLYQRFYQIYEIFKRYMEISY